MSQRRKDVSLTTDIMLWTIFLVLILLWLLGFLTANTMGGLIHLLLLIAVVVLVLNLLRGRRSP